MSATQQMLLGASGITPPGQVEYTTGGTVSWTCPPGVTSVSVVCVGSGGGNSTFSGGGGALAYINNYTVVPGQTYSVKVDGADERTSSYFINTSTVCAGSGKLDSFGASNGGGVLAGNGFPGGNTPINAGACGGGGAGGYSGKGGNGGGPGISSEAGTGGSGGGGGSYYSDAYQSSAGGAGGGVGLFGQGSNGAAGASKGSGGAGSNGSGARYGGGGSGGISSEFGYSPGVLPGVGAVRIIWPGNLRQFPSTRTADE